YIFSRAELTSIKPETIAIRKGIIAVALFPSIAQTGPIKSPNFVPLGLQSEAPVKREYAHQKQITTAIPKIVHALIMLLSFRLLAFFFIDRVLLNITRNAAVRSIRLT